MSFISALPHNYRLVYKGEAGLVAILRPDGTPARISGAPHPLFPSTWLGLRIYEAIVADLRAQAKKGEE